MAYTIQNVKTGRMIKDAITTKVRVYETREAAQYAADCFARDSRLNATAFNNVRPANYIVKSA